MKIDIHGDLHLTHGEFGGLVTILEYMSGAARPAPDENGVLQNVLHSVIRDVVHNCTRHPAPAPAALEFLRFLVVDHNDELLEAVGDDQRKLEQIDHVMYHVFGERESFFVDMLDAEMVKEALTRQLFIGHSRRPVDYLELRFREGQIDSEVDILEILGKHFGHDRYRQRFSVNIDPNADDEEILTEA